MSRATDLRSLAWLPRRVRLVVFVVAVLALWLGVVIAAAYVPLDLTVVLLLALAVVLGVAVVTGPVLGVVYALIAVVLVNWYLVPPYHTFAVASADNVVSLVVFALVAGVAAILAELNARVREGAARTRARADLIADVVAKGDDDSVVTLDRVREALLLDRLSLVRGTSRPEILATAGDGPDGLSSGAALDVPVAGGYRLVGTGPARMAEDPAFVASLAAAAVRSYESNRMESEVRRAEQLAEVDRARTALLASVGHDLRTPLSGLRLAVDTLRDPQSALDEQTTSDLLETIDDSTTRLDELITNLLDMSRLEAGVLAVHAEPTSVDATVAAALLAFPRAPVVVDVSDALPLVLVDQPLLERVLENLVSNAMRYAAPTPGVPIRIAARAQETTVVVEVVDHGPGLGERVVAAGRVTAGGGADRSTGLGLEIVRGLCAAMAVGLELGETDGGGLTVRLSLPRAGGTA